MQYYLLVVVGFDSGKRKIVFGKYSLLLDSRDDRISVFLRIPSGYYCLQKSGSRQTPANGVVLYNFERPENIFVSRHSDCLHAGRENRNQAFYFGGDGALFGLSFI
jgi:hypothetical protein